MHACKYPYTNKCAHVHTHTHTHTHTHPYTHIDSHTHTYTYTEHRRAAIPATAWVVPSWPGQHCNQSLDSHWSASVQTKHAFFTLLVYKNNTNTHTKHTTVANCQRKPFLYNLSFQNHKDSDLHWFQIPTPCSHQSFFSFSFLLIYNQCTENKNANLKRTPFFLLTNHTFSNSSLPNDTNPSPKILLLRPAFGNWSFLYNKPLSL